MATPGADRLALAHQREIATIAGGVTSVVVSVAMGADLASISTWYWGVIDGLLTRIQVGYAQSRNSAMSFLPRHAALAGAPRPLELVPGSLDTAALRKRLEIVGPIGFKRAIAAGRSEEDALRAMATNMAGVADEAVRNGDRDVVEMTARHGRGIAGWRRRIGARACGFCAMLASRGAVYASKQVATFTRSGERYHPHCHCWAEPVYRGEPDPPEVWALRHQWERVTAGHSGKDAIRVWRRHWETVVSPRARRRAGVVDMRQVVLRGAPTQAELSKLSMARLRAMVEDYDITVPADLSKSQLVKLAWDLERGLAPQHARALAVQSVLDQRKVVADVLAEAAEMVAKDSSAKALQWLGRSIRKGRPGVNPDAPEFATLLKQMQPLLDALDAADPAAIRAAIPKVAKTAKLRPLGEAGEVVPYRREHMQFIGQSRGEFAQVIRPGFATQYDGELRILLRADVMPATAEQAAAARIASLPKLRFAASKAKTYRSTGAPKRAELREGPATIRAEWGEEQHFAGRWYAVLDEQGNVRYGAAEREWLDQNEPIPGQPGMWRKVASVEAYQHRGAPRRVETVLADGTRETVNVARDGDWIVRQANGEVMVIPDPQFRKLYEAAPPKKPPTKAAPSQPTLAPRSEGRNLTDQLDDIADQSRGEQFNSILRRQGFDRPATVTDARGVDAIVDQGGIELFRGSSAERARALAEGELAAAGDAMGAGAFGRGIYAGNREVAERYAAPDGLTRMALRPDARVITMEDLRALREQMLPSWTDQQAAMFYDPGQFAAALGYDAIAYGAKGAPLIERNFVILNRSALVIERGPVRRAAELRKMTPKQLREYAEQRGIALPEGARKAEILEAITKPRRAAKTMAPTKAVPPAKKAAKKAVPTPAELAEASRLAMTNEEARAALAKARTVADLREAARLRRVHVSPRATRQEIIDELVQQDVGARLQYAAMTRTPMRPGPVVEPLPLPEPRPPKKAAKAPAKKAPAKKAAPRQPRPQIEPSREAVDMAQWLEWRVTSRDEAREIASRLTTDQLREVAAAAKIPLRSRATRAEMIDEVVRWTTGKRLQAEALVGRRFEPPLGTPKSPPAWAREAGTAKRAPEPVAAPKMGPRASRLPRIAEPQDVKATALATNPKYGGGGAYEGPVTPAMLADGGVSYAQNCSRVVVAYEMRRRGLDVTAGPGTPMGDTPAVYLRTFRDGGRYAARVVRDLSRSMSAREIAREVESWPLGARGIVTLKGHTLNVERDPVTGKAVFIDAQAAKAKNPVMDLQAFIRRMKARGAPTDRWMAVARVDDLDLSDWGLRYVEAPDLDPAAAQVRRTPWPDDPDSERFATLEEMAEMTPDDTYPS